MANKKAAKYNIDRKGEYYSLAHEPICPSLPKEKTLKFLTSFERLATVHFLFSLTSLSRLFHSYRDESIGR